MARRQRFLVCYDIADRRRLGRVHRRVSQRALPVQYSVYLFLGTPDDLEALLDELRSIIKPGEDDVRVYPVPAGSQPVLGGANPADHGLFLTAEALGGFGAQPVR